MGAETVTLTRCVYPAVYEHEHGEAAVLPVQNSARSPSRVIEIAIRNGRYQPFTPVARRGYQALPLRVVLAIAPDLRVQPAHMELPRLNSNSLGGISCFTRHDRSRTKRHCATAPPNGYGLSRTREPSLS